MCGADRGDDMGHGGNPGITSACAEQTYVDGHSSSYGRDHLRVCGADKVRPRNAWFQDGSPPRVRSRRCRSRKPSTQRGITLRVCGADCFRFRLRFWLRGSPPRVRSRHRPGYRNPYDGGITSACAEQTVPLNTPWNTTGGSPPRVRSRRWRAGHSNHRQGITSACAEQTRGFQVGSSTEWDHLRVCGAD